MPYFYHYTSRRGSRGIRRDGYVRASDKRVKYGSGVFLTKSRPEDYTKKGIAQRIYGNGYTCKQMLEKGRIDYVVRVRLDRDEVTKPRSHRDIYIYEGNLRLKRSLKWKICSFDNAENGCYDTDSDSSSDSDSDGSTDSCAHHSSSSSSSSSDSDSDSDFY